MTFYTIFMVLAIIFALAFVLLVYFTGKGDAMSGSGGVRTTFKGKASFEDTMSRATLFLGIGFMALMLIIDAIGNRIDWGASLPVAR